MPNRCVNSLVIQWPPEDVTKISKYVKKNKFFASFLPMPKSKAKDKKNEDGWYIRNISNRWTKRDVCKDNMYENSLEVKKDRAELYLEFDTARSPPLQAMEYLAKKHDKIQIKLRYSEWGIWFSWEISWADGEEEYHEEYDDSYFWEGKLCDKCGYLYDWDNPDDWSNEERTICYSCWEEQ